MAHIPIETKITDPLKQCFINIARYKKVTLELKLVHFILSSQFKVDLNSLDPLLAQILPEFLVYRMRDWPGFRDPKFLEDDAWYETFVNFLSERIHRVIHKDFSEVMSESQKQQKEKVAHKATGTDVFTLKPDAPFSINITGEASVLNSMAFTLGCDNNNNDVLLRRHHPAPWSHADIQGISMKQLLTWPHVGVSLFSPVLTISRKNLHDFHRYVSLLPNALSRSERKFIESTKIINQNRKSDHYDIDSIRKMIFGFLNALECVDTASVNKNNFEIYKIFMEEFLSDIEEMNILRDGKQTITTNTSILFNIGKKVYFRTKKLRKLDEPSLPLIGYTEVIVPRMKTSIEHIGLKNQIRNYFSRLRRFNSANTEMNPLLPYIMISCLFCHVDFYKLQDVVNHFIEEHKMEPPMVCIECKKTFHAFELSKNRWGHKCQKLAKSKGTLTII